MTPQTPVAGRYLSSLRGDAARIAELLPQAVDRPVPGCPGWVAGDVVRHLAQVYRHKAESVRRGSRAPDLPLPVEPRAADALADELRESLAELLTVLSGDPSRAAWTWWDRDPSVGFWQRRMAQETLIHRVDVEQAAGIESALDPELALDGVDEVLSAFLEVWLPIDGPDSGVPADLTAHVSVETGERAWDVRVAGTRATVHRGAGGGAPARLAGPPDALLLWAWGRGGPDRLSVRGDESQVAALRRALEAATQ